jgi:hypothetical protein
MHTGREWPYYKVGEGCEVVLDSSIPDGAKLREPGFVSFDVCCCHMLWFFQL